MTPEIKTTSTAYFRALAGAVFGLLGLHRYYLGFAVTASIMTMAFLGGVLCMAISYVGVLEQVLGGYTQLLSGGNFGNTVDLNELGSGGFAFWGKIGAVLSIASIAWFFADLATMPHLTKKANRRQG